jgi:hypothetical protein
VGKPRLGLSGESVCIHLTAYRSPCVAKSMTQSILGRRADQTQWSTKSYDFTPETPIVFPPKLASLCTEIVREIPWKQVFASSSSFNGDADGSTETPEWSSWTQDYG